MAHALPKRADIPKADTWDLEALFKTHKHWEQALKDADVGLARLSAFKGRLVESVDTLLSWFKTYAELVPQVSHIYTYAALHSDSDTTNQTHSSMAGRAAGLYARLGQATAFAQPELLAIKPDALKKLIASNAGLALYAQYFDNVQRMRPHVRSGEVEQVLALGREALSAPERAHGMLADADLKYAPAVDGAGQVDQALPRQFRRVAWQPRPGVAQERLDTLLRRLSRNAQYVYRDHGGQGESHGVSVKGARLPDALTYALHPNAIPNTVYQNVIDSCQRNQPIWHRFWEAKRKLLGLRKMEGCDVFAPMSKPVKISYEQACEYLVDGLQPMGKDYVDAVRTGVTKARWVDWRPNIGKRGGAYSAGGYGTRPYILMSYDDGGLNGLSTLAHEIGHSMHTLLACKTQPFVYSDYTLFVAEVASNFNQALVRAHLINSARARRDRNFQIAVIEEAMYNFHRYLFVMPILSNWELWMHQQVEQGGSLTPDGLNGKLAELLKQGYGPAWKLDPAREGVAWATFPHFYADFYVYAYASGIAAANALAAGVLADGTGAATKRYLTALSAGSSLYPLDTLKLAGVDMTTPEPMDRAFKVLEGFVARLEALV